jgi:hypothetical protein
MTPINLHRSKKRILESQRKSKSGLMHCQGLERKKRKRRRRSLSKKILAAAWPLMKLLTSRCIVII